MSRSWLSLDTVYVVCGNQPQQDDSVAQSLPDVAYHSEEIDAAEPDSDADDSVAQSLSDISYRDTEEAATSAEFGTEASYQVSALLVSCIK